MELSSHEGRVAGITNGQGAITEEKKKILVKGGITHEFRVVLSHTHN